MRIYWAVPVSTVRDDFMNKRFGPGPIGSGQEAFFNGLLLVDLLKACSSVW